MDIRLVRDRFSGQPRGFAFVQYAEVAQAARAMQVLQVREVWWVWRYCEADRDVGCQWLCSSRYSQLRRCKCCRCGRCGGLGVCGPCREDVFYYMFSYLPAVSTLQGPQPTRLPPIAGVSARRLQRRREIVLRSRPRGTHSSRQCTISGPRCSAGEGRAGKQCRTGSRYAVQGTEAGHCRAGEIGSAWHPSQGHDALQVRPGWQCRTGR